MQACEEFIALFRATYLTFHRRDAPRSELSGTSRAVLQHLAMTGPLTVGEAARHFRRAQSVVSEIVRQLEGHGLLAREPDPQDRRRTLIWLTDAGFARLRADSDVLSAELLAPAMSRLAPQQRTALLAAMRALLEFDEEKAS